MPRNKNFDTYVEMAKRIAGGRGLAWPRPPVSGGKLPLEDRWDLDLLAGVPKRSNCITHLDCDPQTRAVLNERQRQDGLPELSMFALSADWSDLLLAVAIDGVLLRRNQPQGVLANDVRPLRLIATCTTAEPYDLTVDDIRLALSVAADVQTSGKLKEQVEGFVKNFLDGRHLCNRVPLLAAVLAGGKRSQPRNPNPSRGNMRKKLNDRKSAEKLPEMQAFWELVRILFTEQPRTFVDAIQFDLLKVQICTGFRIGETCLIPVDWRRERFHVAADGRPAGELGGMSRSVMLRHFAEKQSGRDADGVILYEATQHIPQIFEGIIEEAMRGIIERTAPLRRRLQGQCDTGRIFPELNPHQLVPAREFYRRLSGDIRVTRDRHAGRHRR